jgi:hypothetical protein
MGGLLFLFLRETIYLIFPGTAQAVFFHKTNSKTGSVMVSNNTLEEWDE